jgi:hypothetical protein
MQTKEEKGGLLLSCTTISKPCHDLLTTLPISKKPPHNQTLNADQAPHHTTLPPQRKRTNKHPPEAIPLHYPQPRKNALRTICSTKYPRAQTTPLKEISARLAYNVVISYFLPLICSKCRRRHPVVALKLESRFSRRLSRTERFFSRTRRGA